MPFFDWFRKKIKKDTADIAVEHTQSVEKVENKDEIIISTVPVITSEREYNSLDVISVFQYALKKYGNRISSNPTRLRDIMTDLGPNIPGESNMLIALSSKDDLILLVETGGMTSSEARLLFDRMLTCLVEEECIDKKKAYLFLNKLFDSFIGKEIIIDALEKDDSIEENSFSQSVERSTRADEFNTKATIEQLKQRLIDEENARKEAEEMAKAERAQRQLLENQLKEEHEKLKMIAYDSDYGIHQETSGNSTQSFVSVNKQRALLMGTLKIPMQRLVDVLHEIAEKGSPSSYEMQSSCLVSPNATNTQNGNQRALLVGTLKMPMQRLVNVLHEIAEKDASSNCDCLTLRNTTNTPSENQSAILVETQKMQMQRLVNVLHKIAEKNGSSSHEMYDSDFVLQSLQNLSNTQKYFRPTSSYSSSSYSSRSPSYYSSSSHTYIPTGRIEYVSGHWRRRNGKLEYVRPHTRRK